MGDAVIVSAARTAIGTARKGSLVDVDAFDARAVLDRRGAEALRDPVRRGRRHRARRGRSRVAATSPATSAVELGIIEVPGAAHNRHCASGMAAVQTRRREHQAPGWTRS